MKKRNGGGSRVFKFGGHRELQDRADLLCQTDLFGHMNFGLTLLGAQVFQEFSIGGDLFDCIK